jgi:hypothetical protein
MRDCALDVIVPSRGRPQAVRELVEAFASTSTADTRLTVALDEDDPEHAKYIDAIYGSGIATHATHPNRTMVEALNRVAVGLAASDYPPFAVAFLGDDHRPRTAGWDAAYLEALRELGTGIVFGNDLLQCGNLPTQCAMTSDIVRALGWMCPPTLRHMYVDNFWRDLANLAGCLQYLPEVVVEHMHPFAGKAPLDAGYKRVNARDVYAADQAAYMTYTTEQLFADAAKVRSLRG